MAQSLPFEILFDATSGGIHIQSNYQPIQQQLRPKQETPGPSQPPENALFRLTGFRPQQFDLHLELQATDYPDFRYTRSLSLPAENRWTHLANPLAVCCVCVTKDGYVLIEQRGQDVGLYRGFYHVVGGYSEVAIDRKDPDVPLDQAPQIVPDFHRAMQREIVEELGPVHILPESLKLLGLVYDLQFPHPELCFHCLLEESLQEIQQLTLATPEFNSIIPLKDEARDLHQFLQRNNENIVPTGNAALRLYQKHRFGVEVE